LYKSYYRDSKLKIGIFGFTGCAGDQLVIIHDEDRLLDYFMNAEIKSFIMASSNPDHNCDLDVALVEGSINTEAEREELLKIRSRSKLLIAIGSCAVHGGIQAGLFNDGNWEKRFKAIYGDVVTLTTAFDPTPLSHHVKVDLNIPGCPIDKDQIYEAFSRLVHGVPARTLNLPVCHTCKMKENYCILQDNILCLGPVTLDGCKAACPSNNVACMGCYGLYPDANLKGFMNMASDLGFSKKATIQRLTCHGGATLQEKLKEINEEGKELIK
jgi:sulfhydrogenase subunit delta